MALQRSIGVVGLTMIGVGGVIGSGWLFAPMLAAQHAGPAAVVSWVLAGGAVFLIALTFAETCGRMPVAGGLGRIPYFTHGRLTAAAMGWTAWVAYAAQLAIEVTVMLRYLADPLPWLAGGEGSDSLSLLGNCAAVGLLALIALLNAAGVMVLIRINSSLTWFKVGLPLLVAVLLVADRFTAANFTAQGGFAPSGWDGILSAISTGGVVFAFLGFRHVIDMAGEARRPEITVPAALGLSVLICLGLYLVLQVAFIGALSSDDLAHGWQHLKFSHGLGPLGALAVALGMVWLSYLLLAGAIVAPFGAALVSTGSNARLGLGLAHNGFFPSFLARLSAQQVPLNALVLNFVVASAMYLLLPFDELVALIGAALAFSLAIGPLGLLSLRRQQPVAPPGFRLPLAGPISLAAFILAMFIIYWAGWDTVWRLAVALASGGVLFAWMQHRSGWRGTDARQALWLVPYFGGLLIISWLGGFGGGRGLIPLGWDMALLAVLASGCLVLGVNLRLDDETAARHREESDAFDVEI